MEPKFQTSFIPKKPVAVTPQRKKKSSSGVFSLIALILFLSALASSVGAFLYQQYLVQSIERKEVSLERARSAFEPALIKEMSRLDARMLSAQEILNKHTALSAFFELLESTTLKTVQFDDFGYSVDAEGKMLISMKGKALSFASVALQSDSFGDSALIQEPIFSGLNLDTKGNVVFDFTAILDPSIVSYIDGVSLNNGL